MDKVELRWRVSIDHNVTTVNQGMQVPTYVRTLQYRQVLGEVGGLQVGTEWQDVREFYDYGQPVSEEASRE